MTPSPDQARTIRRTAFFCALTACFMVGAAFAAVPLYDLFCRVTGFGGTPMVGTAPSAVTLERTIHVRFDANVAPGLKWRFLPETPQVTVKIGETKTIFYKVRNEGETATTGIASFNVQPEQAGAFFTKIQCFCFTEHTLQAGEEMDSAVVFYVDPALASDANAKGIHTITLSYTYFSTKGGNPLVSNETPAAVKKNL
jgi:cytochrome c oxidase assembly protein subunit 11